MALQTSPRLILSITVLVVSCEQAAADLVTFQFSGEVTTTALPSAFPLGEGMSGTYTFESQTTDDLSYNPEIGSYSWALTHLEFATESFVARSTLESTAYNGIFLYRDHYSAQHTYSVLVRRDRNEVEWGPSVDDTSLNLIILRLTDEKQTAIDSVALLSTPPLLPDFSHMTVGLHFGNHTTPQVTFTLESLSLAPVSVTTATWGRIKASYRE